MSTTWLDVKPRRSCWNLGGLLGLTKWRQDGEATPLMTELPGFDQILLAR